MTRNYRICHRPTSTIPTFQIHEVFYNDEGKILFYEKTPAIPHGDIEKELYADMCLMMDAFDHNPLDLDLLDKQLEKKKV